MKKKLLVLVLALCIFVPNVHADEANINNRIKFLNGLSNEIDFIVENYYGDIDEEALRKGILKGMHDAVDPWAESYSIEEYNEFKNSLSGDYVGLGIFIKKVDDYILVNGTIEGSSAEKFGFKAGDRIYAADGKSLKDLEIGEAVKLLKGKNGSKVQLKIKRMGSDKMEEVSIVRKPFVLKSVKHYKKDGVDVIKVMQFGKHTYNEIKEVLDKNTFEKGFILDLRDNPGGYLEVCRQIADELLPAKDIITIIQDTENKTVLTSTKDGRKDNIVVLINENSASASELLSAALKENDRAEIVGQTSYGKGLIQQVAIYGDRYIKLTQGEYKSPKGNPINKIGVIPDKKIGIEQELFDLHSKLQPLLSYTEIKKGDKTKELLGIEQRFNYLGKSLDMNENYDDKLYNIVKTFQKNHGLKADGVINFAFKQELDKEVKSKAYERTRERQINAAISELKKLNR